MSNLVITEQPARLFSFLGGDQGRWLVQSITPIIAATLAPAARLDVIAGDARTPAGVWTLRGVTSNVRYVERAEKLALLSKQEGLGRPGSRCGVLIPIKKSDEWWSLTQDERREIFAAHSKHIEISLKYLPAIARRLHHCRDLGTAEPFDFLTWFEYAPAESTAFDDLLQALRESLEWRYVEREVEIRCYADGD